jgi:signal transduction histidine kinase
MPINGRGVTARAVRENQALLFSDVRAEPDFVDANEESRSELAVVFRREGKPIGVLNVEHPGVRWFDSEDRLTLIALSNLAEVALRNAEQYKELEKTKDSMLATEAVAWLGIFGADWQHTISQKTFSFHNYTNALRIWLARQKALQVPSEVHQVLDGIDTLAQEMQTAQFISRVPSGDRKERRAVTEIDVALPPIVDHWCRIRKDVERIWDLNCRKENVQIDPQWLRVVMEKLVNNALKAMPQGGTLTISTRRVGDQVQITFKDTGSGIPPESLPYFLKRAVPRPAGSPSSGMGALIARFILLKHGGNLILVTSKPGQGTELLMTLPIAANEDGMGTPFKEAQE